MFRTGKMYSSLKELGSQPHLGRMKPFKILGNTYFIGTYQASSHLIDTGDGLIMIDTGYAKTAYLVLDSIYKLGFKPEDIKYIINTHWHGDHTEATAGFAALTGAKTLIGRKDAERASKHFTADILIDDGDTLTLGNTTITFLHTPGHTEGTVSFFYDVTEGDKTYRVGSFGGAGLNTLSPARFEFEGCREAYFASIDRLLEQRVDVFIGNHTWNNGTYEKYETLVNTGRNEFLDPETWQVFLKDYRRRLEEMIRREVESAT